MGGIQPPPMPDGPRGSLAAAAGAAQKRAAVNQTADAGKAFRTYQQGEFDDLNAKIRAGTANSKDIFRLGETTVRAAVCYHNMATRHRIQ